MKRVAVLSIIIFLIFLILFFMPFKKRDIKKEELSVREPVVDGVFYPLEKEMLEKQIKDFLAQAEKIEGKPKILIIPHAGYDFSGQAAAYGFKQLEGENFKRVILIGPSHIDWFDGIALSEKDIWRTPLGDVAVDVDFCQKLIKENKKIFYRESAHFEEHSLEAELPFLQKVLADFKIVPIIMGEPTAENAKILSEALKKNIDGKTLIIISSDLSHYPSYETAVKVDKKTIESILSGKIENFEKTIKEELNKNLENLETCACGEGPIKVALLLAKSLELEKIKLLKYTNTGDANNDHYRVVGYASIGFFEDKNFVSAEEENFSSEEKLELLSIARKSVVNYLEKNKISEFEIDSEKLKQIQGAFVTLRKNGELRGCIGIIEENEKPLYKVVSEMAIAAAVEDSRFDPVNLKEMDEIKIEISVLSPLKKIADPFKEIEIGKHGVMIKQGLRGGVFLPQVAMEENWDLEEFMDNLCEHKAGLPKDIWKSGKADIYIFSTEVFKE